MQFSEAHPFYDRVDRTTLVDRPDFKIRNILGEEGGVRGQNQGVRSQKLSPAPHDRYPSQHSSVSNS